MIDCVATLITQPGRGPDLAAALAQCTAAVRQARLEWLSEDEACDLIFSTHAIEIPTFRERFEDLVSDLPVDVIVQPAVGRRKKLLIADMDSTMIGQECIDELADYLGLKAKVSGITERAMRGEIAFAPALRERVALLVGLDVSIIDQVIAERITPTPGGRALVATMRAAGAHTILVSGGFTAFAERVGADIGFEAVRANVLLAEDGKLTGKVAEPILGRETKLATLEQAVAARGLELGETLAVGDGANDLDMIRAAGLGVAFRAKPAVAAAAAARIDHADLTALLFAQGYRRDAFAA